MNSHFSFPVYIVIFCIYFLEFTWTNTIKIALEWSLHLDCCTCWDCSFEALIYIYPYKGLLSSFYSRNFPIKGKYSWYQAVSNASYLVMSLLFYMAYILKFNSYCLLLTVSLAVNTYLNWNIYVMAMLLWIYIYLRFFNIVNVFIINKIFYG